MPSNPWHPFSNRLDFEFADIHFSNFQSSKSEINWALDFWLAMTMHAGGNIDDLPWSTADQMYQTIDSIKAGPVPWKTVQFCYTGPQFPGMPPKWALQSYELCFCNPRLILQDQLASPDLHGHFNYVPYMQFNGRKDHVWSNLMLGAWAWQEAVRSLFIPPITLT